MSKANHSLEKIPQHVGIIINNDYGLATAQSLSHLEYLNASIDNMHRVINACLKSHIRYLTVYIFSSKHWNLPKEVVQYAVSFMEHLFVQELARFDENQVQLHYVGQVENIDQELKEKIRRAVEITKNNNRLILNIAFNYSGREEILRAVRNMLSNGITPGELDEIQMRRHLFMAGQPDPDLVVHLGGDMRVSDFLIWQATYAEDYVTSAFWNDFDEEEFDKALQYFRYRERRFGVLPKSK
jgi:undecaprenyl diphosphate synthase